MNNIPKSLSVNHLNEWIISDYENPIIIDVREEFEVDMASLNFVDYYIPISKVSLKYVTSRIGNLFNKKYVIICHKGIRSFNFAQWMLDNQLANEVWNLEEGIDGWSIHIDSDIPRY
tara:strand:- start:189 stop:539 length:351 start_codon:yes stop_codon:yes gene_type:complete